MDFITYQLALAHTPLTRKWGEAWNLISAVIHDVMISGAKDATQVRFIGECPEDALAKHGRARGLQKTKFESYDVYRQRLIVAFDTWLLAGTPAGVEQAINVVGGPGCNSEVIENFDWVPDPPDHDLTQWWRFWVVIHGIDLSADGNWNDPGDWEDGGLWDFGGTVDQAAVVDAIRNAINIWKAAHTICVDVEIVLDLTSIHFTP